MDSEGGTSSSQQSEPPALEAMDGSSGIQPPQQVEQPQQHSDDSQMDDSMQEVSSHSSSQMPELEQMEGGPDQIMEEELTSQDAAPDVEAMEVAPPQQVNIVEEQVSLEESIPATTTSDQIVVIEEQIGAGEQVKEQEVAPAGDIIQEVAPAVDVIQDVAPTTGAILEVAPAADIIQVVAPAADVIQDVAPAVDIIQEVAPAADIIQVVAPAADVIQEVAPAADVIQDVAPAADAIQEVAPAADIIQVVAPAADVIQDMAPAADVIQEVAPAADIIKVVAPAADVIQEMAPAADVIQEVAPAADIIKVVAPAADVIQEVAPAVDVIQAVEPGQIDTEAINDSEEGQVAQQDDEVGKEVVQTSDVVVQDDADVLIEEKPDEIQGRLPVDDTEMIDEEQLEEPGTDQPNAAKVSEEVTQANQTADDPAEATKVSQENQEAPVPQENQEVEVSQEDVPEASPPQEVEKDASPQEKTEMVEAEKGKTAEAPKDEEKESIDPKEEGEPAQKKAKLDTNVADSKQDTTEAAATKKAPQRKPDTKIVLTLSPESAAKKGEASAKPATTTAGQREVVLSFNMQDMLAATDKKDGEERPAKTMPMNVQVGVPKTRQAAKRTATKDAPAANTKETVASPKSKEVAKTMGLRSSVTPAKSSDDASSSLRRSSRRKSSTPKWRPKDLLESPSEEEDDDDDDDDEEEEEEEEEKAEEVNVPVTRKRGRPRKDSTTPIQPKKATPSRKGKTPKIKSEPQDKPIKIKQEPDPDWYGGKPKSTWVKKEERALVMYIVDWQKQAPAEEEEESSEDEDDDKMTSKEYDEMHLLIPQEKNDKEWKECADFVSKSTQKPMRTAKSCHEFALTIQECMTNEGAMEHYDLDETKVRQNFIGATSKKPHRGKQAGKTLWTDEEEQALVNYVLFWQIKQKPKMIRSKPKKRTKRSKGVAANAKEDTLKIMPVKSKLWDDCAKFISRKACLPKRTGPACRSYALGIQKKYKREEAIETFEIDSEYDSDAMEVPPASKEYDQYMQDDNFIFNLWLSEMGKLTSYQEEHVLHRLLLKKISRGEFKTNDFMFYFKHLPKEDQSEVAELITSEGQEEKEEGEQENGTKKSAPSSKLSEFQTYAYDKQRSMQGFTRQMQVNLHQSEKQLKNMRQMVTKLQNENKYLHDKIKTMKEVIGRVASTNSQTTVSKKGVWSMDMDMDLNVFRKKHLFQWLLLNGYIPRLPKEDIGIPKGLFYCIFTAIEELEDQGRPNAVFHFAKALCLRKTNGDRVMPANRMPFALLEANIMFFGGKGYNFMQQEGYKRWVETQYAWFGEVWFSLFGGPNMKSMAGEEPKPLQELNGESIDNGNGKSENGEEADDAEPAVKKTRRYEIRLQPDGFTPPADSTEYYKVGERWGKLVPLEDDEEAPPVPTGIIKNTTEGAKQIATRKSTRQTAKATTESRGDASEGETSTKTAATPSPKASPSKAASTPASEFKSPGETPTSTKRRGKRESALDVHNIDKFIEEHAEVMPEGPEMWANPPDYSYEDDFIVAENSDLNKVRLNVVSGTPRSIQRRLTERVQIIDPDATVKEDMLQQLKRVNPAAKWWIKTGWCDITANKALRITGKLEFTGDEDLGDGSVLECQEMYRERLKKARAIGAANRKSENALREDLFRQIADLQDDNGQLCEGLRKVRATRGVYKSKMGVPERAALDAAVDKEISTYVKLLEKNQDLRVRIERALSQGSKARVITLRNDLAEYLTQFTIRMRTIANYVLIFMISDEQQNTNPHSWPVRMVPVNSITRELVETLRDQLIEAMVKEDMEVVGIIRDELTPHLAMGSPDRAVCITQLLDEARTEVSTFHPSEMEKYFTIVTLFSRSGQLKLTPQWRHAAVPDADVVWMYNYKNEKTTTFLQALQALHNKLFPDGYTPYPFRATSKAHTLESEQLENQLRALMAIYIFRHKIKTFAAEGVDFDNYLYAPAIQPLTKKPLHVRDSVTKLLRAISRQAKDDKDLTIEKKQRLSRALDSWFKAAVNTWWTPQMRHEGNQALLDFVLEDWMPYEMEDRKYSAIDVNRPVNTVSFLSEDLLLSLIVNVESENQRPALHPWAATCQDINTFVHLIKNPGQRQNDSRQIMHPQIIKKLCIEFAKAIDPDLEFHYYWGDHEKTLYNILLNLNDPRTKRSATGPKYRKKKTQQVIIKQEKQDDPMEEEEENSKDATEDDEYEEQMELSINADEQGTSSMMTEQTMQAMPPIPIAVNAATPQQTIVTVSSPGPSTAPTQVIVTGEGGTVVQHASTEDIIAAELLRQIEASLQAGVAVVTVTESSQPDAQAVTISESSQPDNQTEQI